MYQLINLLKNDFIRPETDGTRRYVGIEFGNRRRSAATRLLRVDKRRRVAC